MSLGPGTRCTFVVIALCILVDRRHCHGAGIRIREQASQDSLLAEAQMRVLLLTVLGLGLLILLGFLGKFECPPAPDQLTERRFLISCPGCICCFCRIRRTAATASTSDGLDVYAPRTQSIVWPTLPQESGRVLEVTFLHTPKVACPSGDCRLARNSLCTESCGGNLARWILLLVTFCSHAHLFGAEDDFTDFDWLNETQLLFENELEIENNTGESSTEFDVEATELEVTSSVGQTAANISHNGQVEVPLEELQHHRHFARFVLMVLLLHIAVVGVGITIYCCVVCKVRTLKKRSRREAQRRLQLTSLRTEHIPNSRDCPCHGCMLAREMLQGLIMQQWQEVAEC
ncbi:uncharacterized protein LOC108090956 [Drosophila ficusphila]|uniref:uncharacterized protein LOC108090956 n=1 Tax=Drosophila ficusphila TaxID=30025 RepID=UPI0007E72377|nr:uncharacterized protein LOC108090956 [Drosophila ficusphila]